MPLVCYTTRTERGTLWLSANHFYGGTMHHSPVQILRFSLSLLLGLGIVLWLISLPSLLPHSSPASPAARAQEPLIAALDHASSWRDTLLLDLVIHEPGMQLRAGWITWSSGNGDEGRIPLRLHANGELQQVVLPIGLHPAWRDNPRNLHISFPAPVMLNLQIQQVEVVTRSPWAVDAVLGRLLMPMLRVVPPLTSLVVLTGALLAGALALLMPWPRRQVRFAIVGWVVGGLAAVITGITFATTLSQLVPRYSGLSEEAAAGLVSSYNAPGTLTPELIAAASRIPNAPVLVLEDDPESFLVYRTRYLLYPRRVDTTLASRAPSRVADLLADGGYGALIQLGNRARAPLPNWQQIETADDGLLIWVNPRLDPAPPTPLTGPWALPRLIVALLCVVLAGAGLARLLGWHGAFTWVTAWPLGTILLGWWMTLLDGINLPWAWWSIGLPLGLGGVALLMRQSSGPVWPLRSPQLPQLRWSWDWAGGTILVVLTVAVIVQTTLLPFTDQDTWKIWALKAKGFALDGEMAPVLRMYGDSDMHHAAYPPAQPLLLAWGYLSMGGQSERLVKLVFPLWYLTSVLLVWLAGRQWGLRRAAVGWTLLLATAPLMLDHATLGNADLPLATLWTLGTLALVDWIDTGRSRWLWAGVLVLSGAAWLKVDGQGIGVGIILAAVLTRAVALHRERQPLLPALVPRSAGLIVFVLSLVPWMIATRQLNLIDPRPATAGLAARGIDGLWEGLRVMGEELLLSHSNSAWAPLGGGFDVLWVICLGAVLLTWRRFGHDPAVWLLALVVLGGLIAYVGIYALRPFQSIDRYVLHLAPVMVLLAARTTFSTLKPPLQK